MLAATAHQLTPVMPCREAGVRNLKNKLERIYRKAARTLVERGVGGPPPAQQGTPGEALEPEPQPAAAAAAEAAADSDPPAPSTPPQSPRGPVGSTLEDLSPAPSSASAASTASTPEVRCPGQGTFRVTELSCCMQLLFEAKTQQRFSIKAPCRRTDAQHPALYISGVSRATRALLGTLALW